MAPRTCPSCSAFWIDGASACRFCRHDPDEPDETVSAAVAATPKGHERRQRRGRRPVPSSLTGHWIRRRSA